MLLEDIVLLVYCDAIYMLPDFHVNAAGSDGQWHKACGWSVYVSDKARRDIDLKS